MLEGIEGMDWYLLMLIRCYIILGFVEVVFVDNILGLLVDIDFAIL